MDVVHVELPATATATATVTVTDETVAPSVRLVSEWFLFTACSIIFGRAVDYILYYLHVHCHPSATVLRCVYLTHAEAAKEADLWGAILRCAVLQAAAALQLASRRRRLRHGAATVALVAAVIGHVLYARVVGLVLAAAPEYSFYRISSTAVVVFLILGDIIAAGFLILLLPKAWDWEEEVEQAAAAAGLVEQAAAAAGQGLQLPN